MKKKSTKPQARHTELQGIALFFLVISLTIALVTYVDQDASANFLGFLGHSAAFTLLYFLGLGSYIFVSFLFVMASRYTVNKPPLSKRFTLSSIMICMSTCFLATIVADSFPKKAPLFAKKVYAEKAVFTQPYLKTVVRYNLGGVPFYYVYTDFPYGGVKQLLSPSGAFFLFSFTLTLGIFILTKTSLQDVYQACRALFSLLIQKRKKQLEKRQERKTIKRKKPQPKEEIPPLYKKPSLLKSAYTKAIQKRASPTVKPLIPSSLPYSYTVPEAGLLTPSKPVDQSLLKKDLQKRAAILEETLQNFHIDAKVGQIHAGPTITSFEVEPPVGVKVQKITALASNIALSMEAKSIRILAPIPGKAAVGIEVPSLTPQEVSFREMLEHYQEKNSKRYHIPVMLGKTVLGDYISADLTKMPHCLIAGATGSGKSVCINTIVMSILMNARPDEVKMIMIDPKKVELSQYSCLPHMIAPVISESHGAYAALQWLVKEMQLRYEILKQLKLRNIHAFNKRKRHPEEESALPIPIPDHMPFIVGIIDEFADLMMVSSADLETPIARIAQMARAVGIHLILATQRPSREVITGIIKANFPTRIAFKVSNRTNSQIIIDETGADQLVGNGDLLFNPPGTSHFIRAQGAYISDQDINLVIDTITRQAPTEYLIPSFDTMQKEEGENRGKSDALYDQALDVVLASKSASTTYLQRKLKIGYARAASLMDELEENGVVGPQDGARPRKVLRSHESFSNP